MKVEEIIELAGETKLDGIEWGGDVHVRPGNIEGAVKTAQLTREAGLVTSSYGSYYRVGAKNVFSFEEVLETALHLHAPSIRVWAGEKGSANADSEYRRLVNKDAERIAFLAAEKEVEVHFEYHGNTLTDTSHSAKLLMEEVNHPNVKLYWQPAVGQNIHTRLETIHTIKPWLQHVHVFFWKNKERYPLQDGTADWRKYIEDLTSDNKERYFILEFVKNDDPAQFIQDANVLHHLLMECGYERN
ncbi:sugar phosphate isomerase/epimerase family protein [Alteribacillus sp. HJP-4]